LDDSSARAEVAREWLRRGKPERALTWAREAYRLKRTMANAQLIRDVKNRIHEIAPRTQLIATLPRADAPRPPPKVRAVAVRPGISTPLPARRRRVSLPVIWFLIGMFVMTAVAAALVYETARAAGRSTGGRVTVAL
jgi:hypothetical protein